MANAHIRALTARHPIKPTSSRCPSAWQPKPGRRPTYRCGKSVQTTGTTSLASARGPVAADACHRSRLMLKRVLSIFRIFKIFGCCAVVTLCTALTVHSKDLPTNLCNLLSTDDLKQALGRAFD